VRIGKRKDGGGFGLVVELKANLPGLSCEQADDLVRCADGVCPYSHAIHGNVQVTLSA
jgi:lipoyl-dependent peroxiredoxin